MKTRIYYFLKNYLGFTGRESRGFVLVVPVIFVLYLIPIFYDWVLQNRNADIYKEYLIKMDSLQNAGWIPLISNMETELRIVQDTSKKFPSYQKPNNPGLTKISFTEADSVELQVVPGIGQTMAGRIVKFRENLGGLHQKEQLLEVYGLQPEVLDRIFEYFDFNSGVSRKLPVNQADVKSLSNHPYITFGAAKVIVAYRDQHGPFSTADDLLKIRIFNEEWLARIRPYLEF
jgi:competence protein ComEA